MTTPIGDRLPRRPRATGKVAMMAGALALGMGLAQAHAQPPWTVEGQLLVGKTKDGAELAATDISGLACTPPPAKVRQCLIVDDESQGAQAVILMEGKLSVGAPLLLIEDRLGDKRIELDAEAVAYADGQFYVVGSYGRPRHEKPKKTAEKEAEANAEDDAKAEADKHIFRISASGGVHKGNLAPFLQGDPLLGPTYDKPLRPNGLTIEGLAVRGKTMFVGLRGPVFDKQARVLVVPVEAVFGVAGGRGEVVPLNLGLDRGVTYPDGVEPPAARGVRDLTVIGEDLLVLAGPENDPDDKRAGEKPPPPKCGDYAIYRWRGPGSSAVLIRELDSYAGQIAGADGKPPKPEGLTPLDDTGTRLLITFDGPKSGAPVAVTLGDGFKCAR